MADDAAKREALSRALRQSQLPSALKGINTQKRPMPTPKSPFEQEQSPPPPGGVRG